MTTSIGFDGFPFDLDKFNDAVTWLLLEFGDGAVHVRPRWILNLLWTAELEHIKDCGYSMIGGLYEIDHDGPVLADAAAVLGGEKRHGRRVLPTTMAPTPTPVIHGDQIVTVMTSETFVIRALSRADVAHLDWTFCRYGTGTAEQASHAPLVRLFQPEPLRRILTLSEVLDRLGIGGEAKTDLLGEARDMRYFDTLFGGEDAS